MSMDFGVLVFGNTKICTRQMFYLYAKGHMSWAFRAVEGTHGIQLFAVIVLFIGIHLRRLDDINCALVGSFGFVPWEPENQWCNTILVALVPIMDGHGVSHGGLWNRVFLVETEQELMAC